MSITGEIDAEDLVLHDAGEPVMLDADCGPRFWSRMNVEACKIVELIRELRSDPTSYSESVQTS